MVVRGGERGCDGCGGPLSPLGVWPGDSSCTDGLETKIFYQLRYVPSSLIAIHVLALTSSLYIHVLCSHMNELIGLTHKTAY